MKQALMESLGSKVLTVVLLASGMYPAAAEELNLQALQDRAAIADMLTQYSYRWDGKQALEFSELFTEDASMERKLNGEEEIAAAPLVGRGAIYEYALNAHATRLADRQSRHHMSGLVFLELTPGTAETQNMAIITHQRAQDQVAFISSSGIYRISWRKTAEGWRIARRLLISDRFAGQP